MKTRLVRRVSMMLAPLAAGVLLAAPAIAGYLGPSALVASKDGKSLFVANADAKQIAVVDVAGRKVAGSIPVPAEPTGLALSPDGNKLYVTCAAPKGMVCVIDTASGKVAATLPAGYGAMGVAVTPDGKQLYVCNRFRNDVSVIDLAGNKEIARVPATREPVGAAITPDGKTVFVINLLPLAASDSYDVSADVTAIDTATNQPAAIRLPNGSSSVRGICVSPDGKYVYVVHILSRYQMPTTQLERGWMNTNAMSIIDASARKLINTVLLDDVDLGAANPWGVTTTADGKQVLVAHFGTHELSVIDADGVLEKLAKIDAAAAATAAAAAKKTIAAATPAAAEKTIAETLKAAAAAQAAEKDKTAGTGKKKQPAAAAIYATGASTARSDVPNDLAFLVGLRRRIKLDGIGPRGVAAVGPNVYVAEHYSDTLCVVDLESKAAKPTAQIALGPKPEPTVRRRGEMLFFDATMCFQHWQSCGSCHPDTRVDGFNWDLLNDGLGNPKNTRNLLHVFQGGPAMSLGVRESAEAAVRAGITHILFAVRPEEEAQAIDEYLKALEPVPSPCLADGKLSPAAERGKKMFFSPKVG
ncbi:MAG: YncE family protein, partial [Thermoguttaceae bacterium]